MFPSLNRRLAVHVRDWADRVIARKPLVFLTGSNDEHESQIVVRLPISVRGHTIVVPARNGRHAKRFRQMAAGGKEPGTIAWIVDTLKPSDVFLDIGANVGVYSVLAAVVAPTATIVAVEPELQSVAALAETVAINRLPIKVIAVAVGDKLTATDFHIYRGVSTGLSGHQLGRAQLADGETFQPALTIGTFVVTVDDLVQFGCVVPPTHIKIDIDGQELAVLAGMERALSSPTLRWIAIESESGDKTAEISARLAQHGFRVEPKYCKQDAMWVFGRN